MAASEAPLSRDRLPRATAWRFAYLGIQGGASLILFGALAHVLSRPAFAAAAVAQGVLVIAQALGDFGLSQAAVSILPARLALAPGDAPALLDGAARAFLIAAAAALAFTLAAAALVPTAAALPVAILAPAAAATVVVAGADGILRAQGEFRRPVLFVAASRGAAFAAVPVAVVTHSAAWTCAGLSAGTVIGAWRALATLLGLLQRAGTSRTTRDFTRATLPLGLSQLFVVLGTRIDTLLAGAASGLVAAATFEGAWRVYQIGQYAVGAVATAAAPFIADALGREAHEDVLRLVREMLLRLLCGGVTVGAVIYAGRVPLAHVFAGSLSGPVAAVLPPLALLSPLAFAGLLALYTLAAQEAERRGVLVAYTSGAIVNVALATVLAADLGARGVVIGCATGLVVTNVVLLVRFARLLRRLSASRPDAAMAPAGPVTVLERPG